MPKIKKEDNPKTRLTLWDDWRFYRAWGKHYAGRFQVSRDGILHSTLFQGVDAPPVITANYEVLPNSGASASGSCRIRFNYNGKDYQGFIDLYAHRLDQRVAQTSPSCKETDPSHSLAFQNELDHDEMPTLQERRSWRNAAEVSMKEP